jgi:hypothetical protein
MIKEKGKYIGISITPIPGQKLLQYPWTPKFFMDITGRTPCDAQDCETGDVVLTTVGSLFGKEYDKRQVLKLKVCAILRFHHSHLDSLYVSL